MNTKDVPQDNLPFKQRDDVRKLMYATGEDGRYEGVASAGWEAEHAAMQGAWEEVDELLAETKAMVLAGNLSPIAYFMQKNLMDPALLGKYVGRWSWQVKRHCKPAVFNRMQPQIVARYAVVFGVPIESLTNFGQALRGDSI